MVVVVSGHSTALIPMVRTLRPGLVRGAVRSHFAVLRQRTGRMGSMSCLGRC